MSVVVIRISSFVRWSIAITALLVLVSLIVDLLPLYTSLDQLWGLHTRFDVDGEGNVPTFYSILLILPAAALAGVIGRHAAARGDRDSIYWRALSGILLFMACDEAAVIHELAGLPIRKLFGELGSVFRFLWVIPGLILIGLVVVAFWGFVFRLPFRTRVAFIVAAGIYLGGAVGMEMVAAAYMGSRPITRDLLYVLLFTLEESLELLGMIAFIHALLVYLADYAPDTRWRVQVS